MGLKISKISFFLCAALLLFSGSFFYPKWQHSGSEAQISWDASGYYWYLPSVFIYHDLKGQHFKDRILEKYQPIPGGEFQQGFLDSASGNYVMKYTLGISLLEMPFFGIAHIVAPLLGYPADGFSPPYQFLIYFGGICFALIGLWYLRRLLLSFYQDCVTAIILFLLVFGTNYLNYCGIEVGMSHNWLFTLYVLILWNTHLYYLTEKFKYIIRTAILIGFATLVRPTEIISVFIPLLWGLEKISVSNIISRISFFWDKRKHICIAIAVGGLILSMQLLYWKYASGKWFVYSYGDQGFSWLHPHLKVYAFNFQCGWLLYTPMMFLAFAGLIPFLKTGKNRVAIVSFFLLNYYIVAAWDLWDYGGRAMVQSYPVLLFPMASLIEWLLKRKTIFILTIPVFSVFTYFNLWWTYQAHKGGLVGSVPATNQYYWSTIFRYQLPKDIQKLRDNRDYYQDEIKNSSLLYVKELKLGETVLIKGEQNSPEVVLQSTYPNVTWIRAASIIEIENKEWNVWEMTQFVIQFKKGNTVIKENMIRIQRLLDDFEKKNITIDAKIPEADFDHIVVFFRNFSNYPCIIHSLKIIGFKK